MSEAWSARVREARRERERALAGVRSAEKKIAREASRARDAGATVSEIAEVLGVSRQAVYPMVRRAEKSGGRKR